MRKISCMAVIAIAATAGLLLGPIEAFARGGGGGGGFGRGGMHGGFRGGFAHKSGSAFAHHGPFAHRFHRGFWGWGNVGFIGGSTVGPYYWPGYGGTAYEPDVPATDFYNVGVYTGGPYGVPLLNGGHAAVGAGALQSHGCATHEQMVPNTHHGLSSVTVVRC